MIYGSDGLERTGTEQKEKRVPDIFSLNFSGVNDSSGMLLEHVFGKTIS